MARSFVANFVAIVSITLGLLLPSDTLAGVPSLGGQSWVELTPQQKQILAPLAGEWDKLEPWRRKKWIGIAQRYPSMKPEEQQRIQRRMKDWAKLTPEQRRAVREQYKDLKKAPPEHKEAVKQKWQEYKELPEEEKKLLKAQAAAKPAPKTAAGKPSPLATPLTPRSTQGQAAAGTAGQPAVANVPAAVPAQ